MSLGVMPDARARDGGLLAETADGGRAEGWR
jgi:hypothetical protein